MPKSPNQKLKLLHLVEILTNETDEEHLLTVNQLIASLAQREISAERKSIYDDIAVLQEFGMDIVTVKGRQNAYFLGERQFQLAELKLLVDAVQGAKFITAGKSRSLIKKICGLASRHQGGLMQRSVQVQDRAKTFNERTYYNVDSIHSAIAENKKIKFKYFGWSVDPSAPRLYSRKIKKNGGAYTVSPWTLLWDDENYYLVAYDSFQKKIKHYRVDKMERVVVAQEKRDGREDYEKLDMAEYGKKTFGMFGGQESNVRLKINHRLIGVIIDRFGQDIIIHKNDAEHFSFNTSVVVSPQFFSWLLGFGTEVEVLEPAWLVEQVKDQLEALQNLYKKTE